MKEMLGMYSNKNFPVENLSIIFSLTYLIENDIFISKFDICQFDIF